MSDYIFMLESHLSADQSRVVDEVQKAAGQAGVNVFLTGGAMRDMLAGFRIRDLDFVIEGDALKVAQAVCQHTGAKQVLLDENRKSVELTFPEGTTAQLAMSRQEKYARAGAKPQVSPATIQEDLRGRDFTCNAVALSLNRASRGLLLDPMNGLADIERRELRSVSAYGFYDDPSRLLRLARFRLRLGFTVEERTQMQIANAREAEVEKLIPPRTAFEELKRVALEDNPAEILRAFEEAGLLTLFSPALSGPKANMAGLAKLEKAAAMLPDDPRHRFGRVASFLYVIAEKLTPKEKQALIKGMEMRKSEVELWQKLDARAKKLETALRSARIRKASQVYHIVSGAAVDEVVFLLYHSSLRPVQERLKNYYQKYLLTVQEITPEEFSSIEGKPGTPRYAKAREALIAARLDRRVKKPELEPPPEPPVEVPVARRGR